LCRCRRPPRARALDWKDYWSDSSSTSSRRRARGGRRHRHKTPESSEATDSSAGSCLEPDRQLLEQLKSGLERQPAQGLCELFRGTVADLTAGERFDAILYIDVLEHIEDDRGELSRAAARLKPGGHLVVLSPAHNWLFSRFDASIGHYRRYNKKTLLAAAPRGLTLKRTVYFGFLRPVRLAGQPPLAPNRICRQPIKSFSGTAGLSRSPGFLDPCCFSRLENPFCSVDERLTSLNSSSAASEMHAPLAA